MIQMTNAARRGFDAPTSTNPLRGCQVSIGRIVVRVGKRKTTTVRAQASEQRKPISAKNNVVSIASACGYAKAPVQYAFAA
jgi:hypothetical protein